MKAEQLSIFNYKEDIKNDIDKIDIFKILDKIEIKEPLEDIYFYKGDYFKEENNKDDL